MKRFRNTILLFLLTVWCYAVAGGASDGIPEEVDFGEVLGKDCALFDRAKPDTLLARERGNTCAYLFRWTSEKQTDARYPGYSNSPRVMLFGLTAEEMIFRFKEGKANNLYVLFYSRKGKGDLTAEKFADLAKKLCDTMTQELGEQGEQKSGKLTQTDRLTRNLWIKDGFVYEVRWSERKEKRLRTGEYLQLEIYPFTPEHDPRKQDVTRSAASAGSKKKTLPDNVVKDPENGDVFIDNLPMVDQGDKGYCVPAVVERVLRLYGNEDATQHLAAQLFGSDTVNGTSSSEMLAQIKRAGPKLGVKPQILYQRLENQRDLDRLMKKYNDLAKKRDKPRIQPVIKGNILYLQETLALMDPALAMDVWLDDKSDYRNFQRTIRKNVEKGIPVLWGVELGKYPESKLPKQVRGGHLRLIIGWNDKEKTLLYSDTWGAGHEKKAMPWDQAWAITSQTLILIPRK